MLELIRHYSVRQTFLNRKLYSKLIKIILEHTTLKEGNVPEKKVNNSLISLFIILCSVNTAKYYIPGETKEIELLRRRGILNGAILISDVIVELCSN